MHPVALVLPLCLQNIGDAIVLAPTSPANMNGAIDSSMEPLGPIFIDHPTTVGQDQVNTNVLAETGQLELHAAPQFRIGFDLTVRTTILAMAVSYGLTDRLDASLVLPIIQEQVDAQVTIGPFAGHTAFSAAGVSDLSVRLKYRFYPHLAATLQAIFPTGDMTRGFGTGNYWLVPGLAADLPLGKRVLLNAQVAGNVNLSDANHSGMNYGVGISTRVGPVALVAEFLGSVGVQNALTLFDVTYGDGATLDLAFGIRAPLPHGFVVFAAGTYALDHDGIRPAGVSPVLGIGWNVP